MVRQFKPIMRMNNKVMMTIKPDPVHLTLEDIVHDLTCRISNGMFSTETLLMFTKKELKEELKWIAQYRSYNFDGMEFNFYMHNDGEYEEWASKVRAKVLKIFPEFESEAGFPETVQEAFA